MLLNASSLQVHCTAFSVNGFKVSSMLFFLHDQHYRMSVEWHILWQRSCLPLVKSLYTDSYKGGTIVFLMADIFLLTKIRKNDYLSFIRQNTIKFRKYAPMLIFVKGPFWGAYFWRGFCTEGNLSFKIDCNSLPLEGNLPFLLCFILYSRANSMYKPPGTYSEGRFNGGFFALRVWGAYIWRG